MIVGHGYLVTASLVRACRERQSSLDGEMEFIIATLMAENLSARNQFTASNFGRAGEERWPRPRETKSD